MFAPKIPFVGGYEIAGVVEAIGGDVTGFQVGQRVAALTVHGGFAERLVRGAEHFVPIPDEVSGREAVSGHLELRQRVANDPSRGEGSGRPDRAHHRRGWRRRNGDAATPAARRREDLRRRLCEKARNSRPASGQRRSTIGLGPIDRLIRAREPAGVDFVFDAIGGANIRQMPSRGAAWRNGRRLWLHGGRWPRSRKARMFWDLFVGSPPARTPRNVLRHHIVVSKGRKALSRRPAEDPRAGRAPANRPRHRRDISAC